MRTLTRSILLAAISAAIAGAACAQVPDDISAKLAAMGRVIDPPNTAKIYAPLQKTMPQPGIKVVREIVYGPGAKQTLDVFSAEAKGAPRPILVFVHGGGFVGGDKSRNPDGSPSPFYDSVMMWAVNHGLAGVNINYDLAPKAQYPVVQQQIAEAVAWARKNAASFGGDPNRIILWGHSAGAAHVASFVAHPEVYGDVAGAKAPVAGAVISSGMYEFASPKDNVYYGPSATLSERSSTAGLIRSRVPLFVIHAELDPENMIQEAHALDAALTKAGREHQFLTAAKHSHMSETYAVGTADESVSGPVLAFIHKYAK